MWQAWNQQGKHDLVDLNSGKLITWNIIQEVPVTDVVIKAVQTMAYKRGLKSLKVKKR